MKPILHIVNGASVAGSLRQAGVSDIAYWYEALYMGPLKVTDDVAFTSMRTDYWLSQQPWPPDWVLTDKKERFLFPNLTQLIPRLEKYQSIILWLEFDLYDQTMLWYILRQFNDNLYSLPTIFLISPDSYPGVTDFHGLGQLKSEQLLSLIGTEKAVTQEELDAATKAWEVYASGDQIKMLEFIEQPTPLPYLKRALLIHLAQYPQPPKLLGEIQLFMLRTIQRLGTPSILKIVAQTMARYNPDYGLSDMATLDWLIQLNNDSRRLIELLNNGQKLSHNLQEMKEVCIMITENGRLLTS